MDVLAHFLWSFAIFSKKKWKWLAGVFGVLPDLISFGPFFIWRLVSQTPLGKPELASIPDSVFILYNLTHSLIPVILVIGAVYIFTKKIFWPLSMWVLHILIDIPTHDLSFFPTPYLWPFHTPLVDGIQWSHPAFMVINYTALLSVYLFYVFRIQDKLNGKKVSS